MPSDTIEPVPEMASDLIKEIMKGLVKIKERLVILLDIDRLMEVT
jgi:chemotaxis signal transduction protein